ncbi:MAG: methionyl-tRNA formyltransferase [Candidatus Dormibacteria bacterium]
MRVVFAGSAQFSIPVLRALAASSHAVVEVLTAPDRAGSRGAAAPRPVKAGAQALGIPVEQPSPLTEAYWQENVAPLEPDVLVVAAYGQLIPLAVLQSLGMGGVGVHPSLLPRHRGAAPVAAAILAGDARTGVTVFRMDQRLDAGPLLAQHAMPVPGSATTPSLTGTLAELGAQLAVQVLDQLEAGERRDISQLDSGATFSHPLSRQDGRLEWTASASEIDRRLRALAPWPGVTIPLAGTRVKLLRGASDPSATESNAGEAGEVLEQGADWILIGTGDGAFRVELIQPPGRPPMTPSAFLRGRRRGEGGSGGG